jgi:hypothetical protein
MNTDSYVEADILGAKVAPNFDGVGRATLCQPAFSFPRAHMPEHGIRRMSKRAWV